MRTIPTTLGHVESTKLGKVNSHDHIILDGSKNKHIPEDFHHTDIALIAAELKEWFDAGGGAIIDCSPLGAGRNITLLEETSKKSGVPIIASSGFHKTNYYNKDHWIYSTSTDELIKIVDKECTEGLLFHPEDPAKPERSGITAGILKLGVGAEGFTPIIKNLFVVIADVMKRRTIPAMIHTERGVHFRELISLCKYIGMPPDKTIICHMGKSFDRNLHTLLAEEGFFLEFDEMVRPDPLLSDLADEIRFLFDLGYSNQILFAGDLARRSYWKCYQGGPGLSYLITDLSQKLISLGITRKMLNQIWEINPRKLFS